MVLFNYSTKELTAKVVYYGPGLCGKTTNLQWIHEKLPIKNKGKMLSLATEADRTLFFDFLPIELGSIRGMKTRIQLYTVPGQVFYNATRRMVLKGADCVVFVADSQERMLDANLDAAQNLRENLEANEIDAAEIPTVLQYNKRDLPNALPIEILNEKLNPRGLPSGPPLCGLCPLGGLCVSPERTHLDPSPRRPGLHARRRGGDRSGAAGGDRRRGVRAALGRHRGDLALRRRGAGRDASDRHRPAHQGQEHARPRWR